jgi:hypothetical protein
MRRVVALAVCAAVPASASAAKYPKPDNCGTGEPAYTGWNYTELMAYGLSCRKAHSTAEAYVYDLSTEGVIEPARTSGPLQGQAGRRRRLEGQVRPRQGRQAAEAHLPVRRLGSGLVLTRAG